MRTRKAISVGGRIILVLVLINVIVMKEALVGSGNLYFGLFVTLPLLVLAIIYSVKQELILIKFSLIGYLRNFFKLIGSKVQRNYFELYPDGKSADLREQSSAYESGKNEVQTISLHPQTNQSARAL